VLIFRELVHYLKRLVTFDGYQAAAVLVSFVVLVIDSYESQVRHRSFAFSPGWALLVFGFIVTLSGFRLWRDERRVDDREDKLFRKVAAVLREEISTQGSTSNREIVFAKEDNDNAHHEQVFRQHFPEILTNIDEWCQNPRERRQTEWDLSKFLSYNIPGFVPEWLRPTADGRCLQYVRESLTEEVPPEGRFSVKGKQLLWQHARGGCNVLFELSDAPGFLRPHEAVKLVGQLNEWAREAWNHPAAAKWRGLARRDIELKKAILESLTRIVNGPKLTRKYCSRECYVLFSGD
jgi:hypothetical protein